MNSKELEIELLRKAVARLPWSDSPWVVDRRQGCEALVLIQESSPGHSEE
jgi:hypothetical protein